MDVGKVTSKDVLSEPVSLPSTEAARRLEQLVGLDDHIATLVRDLRLIFDPEYIEEWSREHYGRQIPAVALVKDAVPLILFQGDVGTGKTALAESVGQKVAQDGDFGVHVVKMNTQVRGTGYVGEMGTLIAESFKAVESLWRRIGEPILFIIDEADSLLTSRASDRHHHEDKSGVNTILQHLDRFRDGNVQVAVIAITNRGHVLDPALRRRATTVLSFSRPDAEKCEMLLGQLFEGALGRDDIAGLAQLAAERCQPGVGTPFTYSDFTLRLAVPAIRDAVWAHRKLDGEVLMDALRRLEPTPEAGEPS